MMRGDLLAGLRCLRRLPPLLRTRLGPDAALATVRQRLAKREQDFLALLRAAGLVTITESGSVVYYTLRRNRLDDASTDIKRFLLS